MGVFRRHSAVPPLLEQIDDPLALDLASDVRAAYQAGLTPHELCGIYRLDRFTVEQILMQGQRSTRVRRRVPAMRPRPSSRTTVRRTFRPSS